MSEKKELSAWAMIVGTIGCIVAVAGFILMLLPTFRIGGSVMLWVGFGALLIGATAACIGFWKPLTKWQYKRQLKWGKRLCPDILDEALNENGIKTKTKVCPHCGEKIEEASKFCNHCGKEQ